jgi:hypothetical protein
VVAEIGEFWKRNFPRETTESTIDGGGMSAFLSRRGYTIIDHLQAKTDAIQRKYFKFHAALAVGHVPAIFGLVQAAVAP